MAAFIPLAQKFVPQPKICQAETGVEVSARKPTPERRIVPRAASRRAVKRAITKRCGKLDVPSDQLVTSVLSVLLRLCATIALPGQHWQPIF
jgi:hypothetical protein